MSATTTMRAVLAPGEQYDAGLYRAVERDGVLHLACSASRRRGYITCDEAIRASGRARWCAAARYEMDRLIVEAHREAVREVERVLGVPYYQTVPVVVSGGDVCTPLGVVLATLDREEVAS